MRNPVTLIAWITALFFVPSFTFAGTIGETKINPDTTPAGVPVAATVTATIPDSDLIGGSVNLQRLDASGNATTILGTLHDDGVNGDAVANDKIYSLVTTILENTPGAVRFRVSAAFRGTLLRAFSSPLTVNITGTATDITIVAPATAAYLNTSPVTVRGTVGDVAATVTVNGVAAPVAGGTFVATVPLNEGPNTLTAVAINSNGSTSTASALVTLDTTPPRVAIYTPTTNGITTDATVTVTGMVNDIVVGTVNPEQATVTVNGIAAQVLNRTFTATNIPLTVGTNTLQARGVDRAGNSATTTITVTRRAPTEITLRVSSGNEQSGPIRSLLAAPLVAQLLNGAGQPVPNTPVVFRVTNQDGLVSPDGGAGTGMSSMAVNTDAQGFARARFFLGARAGAGNNVIEASATGVATTATFTASATPTAPGLIIVDNGNNQSGVIGHPLPLPLVAVVTDAGYNRLANVLVTFTVKNGGGSFAGQSTFTTTSDSDGRVMATPMLGANPGINNNLIEASFAGNTGFAAAFTASGLTPGPANATRITGVVLDNSNNPLPGVTMRLFQVTQGNNGNVPQQVATAVQTNAQGQFTIQPAPVGVFKLMADGGTAQRPGNWPTLEYDLVTVSGQNNTVGSPIYLPELLSNNRVCVSPTTGGTLTIPQAPGFSLTVAPGAAIFPGGSRTGCISVTPVNMDKVPMVPGFGQQPRFVVTIQPVGTIFTIPAAITIPNVDGLAPRAVTEMYSFDHDLASFVAIGTGTVSEDGSVIRSDLGVGVLKAGWHCGGNPNQTGSSGSLSVTLSAASSEAPAGSTIELTASGTPPLDGTYTNWEVINDPNDPDDDPSVATFETMPTCDNQPKCVAKLKGKKIGIVSVRVTFKCTTTGSAVTSSIVKIKFKLGLIPKTLSFNDSIEIYKDQVGSAPKIMNPVWKDTNSADQNDPVAYVRNSTMKVTVKFEVSPVPTTPVSNVTIEGEIPGLGKFRKIGVTIPAAAEVTIADIAADTMLPNTTKFYNPLTINWRHMADGDDCPKCTMDGSTSNKVYITLAAPKQKVYLTSLHLAVSNDGAADASSAFQKTWSQFAGPANVKSWDSRPLYYYRDGIGFSSCALDEEQLLTTANGSGQCGSFAHLLIGTLAVNGILSEFVSIGASDGTLFLVKDWTYNTPSFPSAPEFKWGLIFNLAAITARDIMVPKQPSDIYGDLVSLATLRGQNTSPPSEKAFASHFIVKISIPGVNPTYYDPSYGVTYQNADDFENKAVDGYFGRFPSDPVNVFRVRRSTGLRNITFDR